MRVLLALFAALLLLSVGSGATASTSTPPRNGLIVVQGADGLYIVDPSAGSAKLIPGTERIEQAAWSPDGTSLAVSEWGDEGSSVYTMAPNGSQRRPLTHDGTSPTWSPDGEWVAVSRWISSSGEAETSALLVIRVDPTEELLLPVDGDVSAPAWSPNGKFIAFVDGTGRIQLVSPDGAKERTLKVDAAGSTLSWSPDSSRLAFARHLEANRTVVVVLDLATGKETVLPGEEDGAYSPIWSPEGDQIAFLSVSKPKSVVAASCGEHFVSHLWVMKPDGTGAHRLAEGEYYGAVTWARALETAQTAEASPADTEPEQQPLPAPPADTAPEPLPLPAPEPAPREDAAPDVAKPKPVSTKPPAPAAATDGLIAVRGSDALYLTNPDSESTRKISDTSDMVAPAWSPDAKLLAVERVGKDESSSIWTISPDGTDPQLVLPNASLPSWSPVGDRIYAVRNECTTPCEPEDEAANVLFSVQPDGKDVRRVEYGEDVDREFAWAPDGDAIGFFADENASDPGTFDSSAATWSPDGFWVAFVGAVGPFDEDTASAPPPYGLWVVSAEGGTPRLLVKGASGRPSWAR